MDETHNNIRNRYNKVSKSLFHSTEEKSSNEALYCISVLPVTLSKASVTLQYCHKRAALFSISRLVPCPCRLLPLPNF